MIYKIFKQFSSVNRFNIEDKHTQIHIGIGDVDLWCLKYGICDIRGSEKKISHNLITERPLKKLKAIENKCWKQNKYDIIEIRTCDAIKMLNLFAELPLVDVFIHFFWTELFVDGNFTQINFLKLFKNLLMGCLLIKIAF